MNLAIEHLIRNKIAENLLELPCSIFLNSLMDGSKIAITINGCYGNEEQLNVKHWRIDHAVKSRILPPQEEFIIKRTEIFTSDKTVLDDYEILKYTEDPYPIYAKQYADEPNASLQEKQYRVCLNTFFNCDSNNNKKEDWLWQSFVSTYFSSTMKSEFASMTLPSQKSMIKDLCPVPWKGWMMWLNNILVKNKFTRKVAAELSFHTAYQNKLDKNEKYIEKISKEKEEKEQVANHDLFSPIYTFPPSNHVQWWSYAPTQSMPTLAYPAIDHAYLTTTTTTTLST